MSVQTATAKVVDRKRPMTREEKRVILASSAGTIFEWYDFYLYGSLAAIIGAQFFSSFPEATRNVFALLAFAAGFLVRPFGALVLRPPRRPRRPQVHLPHDHPDHGRLDLHRRPSAELRDDRLDRAGHPDRTAHAAGPRARRRIWRRGGLCRRACSARPARLLHVLDPDDRDARPAPVADGHPRPSAAGPARRTSRPGAGAFRSCSRSSCSAISVWIRLQMEESPAFKKMKEEGTQSKAPLSEAFGQWKNAKFAVIALFGLVAGQAVVWYTGQFYALFFLQSILRVDMFTANVLIAWSLILGTARLRVLRFALRPHRPQADHPGGLPAGRAHLLPGLQVPHRDRESDARQGAADDQGHRDRRSRTSARSSSIRPARPSSPAPATSPRRCSRAPR